MTSSFTGKFSRELSIEWYILEFFVSNKTPAGNGLVVYMLVLVVGFET